MQIVVTTPFKLNLGGGEFREFDAGAHDVDKKIAEHWYVQAHSEPVKTTKVQTPAQIAAAEKAAKEAAEKEAAEKAEAEAKAKAEQEAAEKAGASKK